MTARLFTVASVVSLPLLLATVAACVRSHFISDAVHYSAGISERTYVQYWFLSYTGNLGLTISRLDFPPSQRSLIVRSNKAETTAGRDLSRESKRYGDHGYYLAHLDNFGRGTFVHDFEHPASADGVTYTRRTIRFPHWCAALALSACPAAWVWRRWRRRIRRRRCERLSLCPHCSYNLTGNTSGICPECGASNTSATANTDGGRREAGAAPLGAAASSPRPGS